MSDPNLNQHRVEKVRSAIARAKSLMMEHRYRPAIEHYLARIHVVEAVRPKENVDAVPVTLALLTPGDGQSYSLNVSSLTIDSSDEAAVGAMIIQWIQNGVADGQLPYSAAVPTYAVIPATTTHPGQDAEGRIIPIKRT